MAKLMLSMDGLVLKEIALGKERVTIGRKPHNDIQIDNLAVSGEHAVVVTILSDSFLEDLGSTNGTLVNGLPIKKHFLQNNDVIELGKYRLKYVADGAEGAEQQQEFEKTMVIRPQSKPEAAVPAGVATYSGGQTPPSGLVDTAQGPATVAMAGSLAAADSTPITMPLPQPMSIMVTQGPPGGAPVRTAAAAQVQGFPPAKAGGPPAKGPGRPVADVSVTGAFSQPLPEEQAAAAPARAAAPAGPAQTASPAAAPQISPPAGSPQAAPAAGAAQAPTQSRPAAASAPASTRRTLGIIQILTGSNAGRELELVKPLTTLGRPQVQVAVITKRPQGYFITHVEGQTFPLLNGKPLDAQAQVLTDHDVIELAGVKMEFYYKE